MEREIFEGKEYVVGYHTQEHRENQQLLNSIECTELNAWLGKGHYFWVEEEFAKYWGEDFKSTKTGAYSIYKAKLNVENCINSVFSEEGYYFFKKQIEKVILRFNNEGIEINLKNVHDYLSEKVWNVMNISGIIYDDLPKNPKNKNRNYSVIKHVENKNEVFYYRKRIQIVVFKTENIRNFEIYKEKQI
jgi:hypothetical protein